MPDHRNRRRRTICFDIDGTLCETNGTDYEGAIPYRARIERVNALRKTDHVIFYTARGRGEGRTTHERAALAILTVQQLHSWGLDWVRPEHLFPKPPADVYVDDRASNARIWFNDENR